MFYIYIVIYGLICLILFAAGILISLDLKNDFRKYSGIKRKVKKELKIQKQKI